MNDKVQIGRSNFPNWVGSVYKAPSPAPADLIAAARELGVSTLFTGLPEPHGRFRTIPSSRLARVVGDGVVAGPAVTAWNAPGSNTMVRAVMESSPPGYVLVMVCPTDEAAIWGELASTWAVGRGVVGAVIDGSVRDIGALRRIGLSVWARSVDPRRAIKSAPGYVNAPVQVGGIVVEPGDTVVADDDGVIVLRAAELEEAVTLGRARREVEDRTVQFAVRGETDPRLTALMSDGISNVASTWDQVER